MGRKKALLFLCLLIIILSVLLVKTFDVGPTALAAGPAKGPVWVEEATGGVIEIGQGSPSTARRPAQADSSGEYLMSTSLTDPLCDTGFDGYVNLEDHSIFPKPEIEGDTRAWRLFDSGAPFSFYGNEYPEMFISDDGYAIFDAENYTGPVWAAQNIPDLSAPNNLAAIFWQDLEVVYDRESNRGVSAASSGDDVVIVEYDDVQLHGDPQNTYDFEIIMARAVDDAPGAYEIIYAYDNLDGVLDGPVTVGVEDNSGSGATTLLSQGSAKGIVENRLIVCFDYNGGTAPNTPTASPTETPTDIPTATPTATPTDAPTTSPPASPTATPIVSSTASPTAWPSASQTATMTPVRGGSYAGTPVFLPAIWNPRTRPR